MATKKSPEYWYLLVMTNEGPKFVTSLEWSTKTARWKSEDKPLAIDKNWVKDLFIGLTWNGHTCYPVCSPIEFDTHPYRYNIGHFEWVKNEEKKESDDDGKN